VLLFVLAIFLLSAVTSAQTHRSENDPRNQSPSVGTGGNPGGPTGLFTIYDGSTIRKGEYTFSIAYSNFDRDPGNVDITEIPISFNIGLNDHLELFFNTTANRGVKVNNPTNLSSFFLPNSQVFFSATGIGTGPAIILAPSGPNVGTLAGTAVFRPPFFPAGNGNPIFNTYYTAGQPFVQSPFIGGVGPNFGLGPGFIGTQFGFPGFATAIGAPVGGNGNFGSASSFPGMGSPVGSILPGLVLATTVLPCTALTGNCRPPGSPTTLSPIVVPVTYTVAPSYLPDAPFINRLYGESSFSTFVAGAKWRMTSPNNALGLGVVPFYRWYADKGGADFNMLQRGASPGGNIGDFGLIGFVDGRLSDHVNLSANVGYILNSNPRNGASVLLDRPDEFLAGIAVDFPINKHFQPLAEFRSTQYVGSKTPNAMNNNPVEFLMGLKVYPRRWWGFGAWYRRAINDQRLKNFNANTANTPIANITGVNVCTPGVIVAGVCFPASVARGIVIVPGTSAPATSNGAPLGFVPSSDPHGFGFQFFAGYRKSREPSILPNQPPTVSLSASTASITLPCAEGSHSSSNSCPASPSMAVGLNAKATDPDGDTLLYTYTVSGGRVTGEGANVNWDLSGVGPGKYTATVEVDDGCGCISFSSTEVTIASCPDCVPNIVCPTVTVSCPDSVMDGSSANISATVVTAGTPPVATYNWSVSAGTITSGQGTSSITVDTTGKGGSSITATVEVGGPDPSCTRTWSCSVPVSPKPKPPRKFDEYGNIRFNDEKARLDNFAIQLQNEPGAQGSIIGYGSCGSEGQERGNRAKDYLVNTRGIDAGRLLVVDGGCKPELKVELWVVPQGATAAPVDTSGSVSPCPDCKKATTKKTRRGRRGEE
jgi:hypothetical protein